MRARARTVGVDRAVARAAHDTEGTRPQLASQLVALLHASDTFEGKLEGLLRIRRSPLDTRQQLHACACACACAMWR